MAESKSTQSKSSGANAQKQTSETDPDTAAPAIPVGQLVSDGSALIGYPPHVVAGALHGHDPEEVMTLDAAGSAVEDWLQQPVQTDEGERT